LARSPGRSSSSSGVELQLCRRHISAESSSYGEKPGARRASGQARHRSPPPARPTTERPSAVPRRHLECTERSGSTGIDRRPRDALMQTASVSANTSRRVRLPFSFRTDGLASCGGARVARARAETWGCAASGADGPAAVWRAQKAERAHKILLKAPGRRIAAATRRHSKSCQCSAAATADRRGCRLQLSFSVTRVKGSLVSRLPGARTADRRRLSTPQTGTPCRGAAQGDGA